MDKWKAATKAQMNALMPWGEPTGVILPPIYDEKIEAVRNPCILAGISEEDEFMKPEEMGSSGTAISSSGTRTRKGRRASQAASPFATLS